MNSSIIIFISTSVKNVVTVKLIVCKITYFKGLWKYLILIDVGIIYQSFSES
jgi:hypothetical protein